MELRQTWATVGSKVIVKKRIVKAAAILICAVSAPAFADHAYIEFDAVENMILSGSFDTVIPKPEGARIGGPEHSTPSFLSEDLKVSKAGFFADDQFIMVQIETTNAPKGTLTNKTLPVYELAGQEFRARTICMDISQQELDADDDPLFEFIELQSVQIVPARAGGAAIRNDRRWNWHRYYSIYAQCPRWLRLNYANIPSRIQWSI